MLGQKNSSGLTKITVMVETVPLAIPMEIVKDMAVTVPKGMTIKMPTVVPKAMITAVVGVSVTEAMSVEVETTMGAIWSQEILEPNPTTSAVTLK